MKISMVAALSQNFVIGVGNRLPWHLPEDLKRFKTITSGHPVIMGRKTYQSIGRVLPHRENLIVTRNSDFSAPGAFIFHSLEQAIEDCRGKFDEIFVIGGAEIYQQALPIVDRMYLTLIHQEIEGDAFFPKWDTERFFEVSREDRPSSAAAPAYSFILLERKLS